VSPCAFITPDIGLAAFLACRGHEYTARRAGDKVFFRFTTTTAADTLAFKHDAALAPAREYYAELKRARGMVWWLTNDGGGRG